MVEAAGRWAAGGGLAGGRRALAAGGGRAADGGRRPGSEHQTGPAGRGRSG